MENIKREILKIYGIPLDFFDKNNNDAIKNNNSASFINELLEPVIIKIDNFKKYILIRNKYKSLPKKIRKKFIPKYK